MELDTMKLLIRIGYEKEELIKYNPKNFEDYLLEKLAEWETNNLFNNMEEIRGKTLKEWKDYCKNDSVPIKTMKYINCLEEALNENKDQNKKSCHLG